MTTRKKLAVVLFNLGGPDSPEAVRPFLQNLFSDPAILRVPGPVRWLLARVISWRRAPIAREIYAHLGGRSPIVPETEKQASALTRALSDEYECRCFISMRYWHPFASEAAEAVRDWQPDEIVLLPLYPQYSTTTTESALEDWQEAALSSGVTAPTHTVCCYPLEPDFLEAHVALIRGAFANIGQDEKVRVLFSAHGLPKKVVTDGDPYQRQVEQTCEAVVERLEIHGLDWVSCYQSRVGPLEWIGPSTEDEIKRAGADGCAVILVPIAFVSEHSETLVELDIEYKELADEAQVPRYLRVPTLSAHPKYIAALSALVRRALAQEEVMCPVEAAGYPCPAAREAA